MLFVIIMKLINDYVVRHKVNQVLEDGTIQITDSYGTMESVSEMYKGYRDFMSLYDSELPGRVVHVRYEELVDDMEGVARTIINAAGLKWSDDVLAFHKKKQTINTFSSTQVRKKVNRSGIDKWKKYERQLQPLVEMLGSYATYDLKTSNYTPHVI